MLRANFQAGRYNPKRLLKDAGEDAELNQGKKKRPPIPAPWNSGKPEAAE